MCTNLLKLVKNHGDEATEMKVGTLFYLLSVELGLDIIAT